MIAAVERDLRRAQVASDLVALLLAGSISGSFHFGSDWQAFFAASSIAGELSREAVLFGLGCLWYMCLSQVHAYDLMPSLYSEIYRILKSTLLFVVLLISVAFFSSHQVPRSVAVLFVPLGLAVTVGLRRFLPRLLISLSGRLSQTRILLLGNGMNADHLARVLSRRTGYELQQAQVPQDENEIDSLLDRIQPHEVIVVSEHLATSALVRVLNACQSRGIAWQFVPAVDQLVFTNVTTQILEDVPIVSLKSAALTGLPLFVKRCTDLASAFLILLLAAPLMAVIWAAVKLTSKGPGIIVQRRVGRNRREFDFYKFRTMYVNSDDETHRQYVQQWINSLGAKRENGKGQIFKIVNDPRVTRIGRFLRQYSLDELPQIFNVLKLEMSLVGPRPALPYELDSYQAWHMERFDGFPGLTGLWQVTGRNRLSFDEMVKLDIEYLRNWSISLDLKILLRTIPAVMGGTGN